MIDPYVLCQLVMCSNCVFSEFLEYSSSRLGEPEYLNSTIPAFQKILIYLLINWTSIGWPFNFLRPTHPHAQLLTTMTGLAIERAVSR